jgi:hypothetical protein
VVHHPLESTNNYLMRAAPEDEDIQASSLLLSSFFSFPSFYPSCTLEHSTMFVRHFPSAILGVQRWMDRVYNYSQSHCDD